MKGFRNKKRRNCIAYIGIFVIAVGLLLNEVVLEKTIITDGSIDSFLIRILLIIAQIITISLGLYLYMAGSFISWSHFALPFVSLLFALLIFEITARVLLKDSSSSYGSLFGRELPPKALIPVQPKRDLKELIDVNASYKNITVNGKKITKGDLWGLLRPDSELGWEPIENATSKNGWYRTNNFGARNDHDIDKGKVSGKSRVLLFGDSFAQGSRLPQEETWAYKLSQMHVNMEVINFGVDAYSMGQALLRYKKIRDRLTYDYVMFLFVPSEDLWREISTMRYLAAGWKSFSILPRFILEQGKLKLVKSPFKSLNQFYEINYPDFSIEALEYLRKYDRFYIPMLYEDPPVLKYLISYKLVALGIGDLKVRRLLRRAFEDLNFEAWKVTREIFNYAKTLTEEHSAHFIVAILPKHRDIKMSHKKDRVFQTHWQKIVKALRNQGLHTIDLLPALSSASSEQLDYGYDGSHFGPRANELIDQIIGSALKSVDEAAIRISGKIN